jgi:hypothetical protein
MPSCSPSKSIAARSVWLIVLAAIAASHVVSAQPAQGPLPTIVEGVPKPGPAEEAPPANVPTPVPIAVPPMSEKEVAPAPPLPGVVKPTGAPVRRTRFDVAVIEALDKVTATSLRFEAAVGRPVRYKSLVFTVKACERSTPDEAVDDSIAYITVDSQPRPAPGKPALAPRQSFKGWMYASSPGLHPLEHPVYDAWLITCRAAAPPSPAPPAR